jgi:hypothetical protein
MMVPRCLELEDIADLASLPEDDPRRRHVAECPRCRTLARRFRDFLAPAPLPPEADAEAAGRMLRRRLSTALPELAPALEADDRAAHDRAATARPGRGDRRGLPVARPLLAVAAVLVACLGLLAVRNQLTQPDAPASLERSILRGEDLRPAALELAATGQGLDLLWGQPADTDASQAVFFDGNLDEIARFPVGTDGAHHLSRVPTGARFVRIEFLQLGDVVIRTRTMTLPGAP